MLSLVDLLAQIDSGALTPEAALQLSLAAIEAREGEIGAFAHLAAAPRPAGHGPLNGIAVGVKDIIDTADMPTAMGSPIYAGWRPKADAALVSALRRAGATIVGKTVTTPFAFMDPAETRNPAAPGHTPGGSSSGSAAAVAAGLVPLAIGTQTGGSVIRPASFCGVAGMKPSFRTIPTVGVKTFSWTLDTIGLFAAGVADLAAAFAILTGRPASTGGNVPPRIGLLSQGFAGAVEPESAIALDRAAAALGRAGATVRPIVAPTSLAEAWAAQLTIQNFEASASVAWEYDAHRDALPPLLRGTLEAAQAISAAEYDEARRVAKRARAELKVVFDGLDALLTYAAPGAAPAGYGTTGEARFNRLWTLLGTPAVTVPGLTDGAGHPVGVQVVAPFARDAVALDVALFLERALASPA